jgi:WhiB family redox-sensing transcriptional regulator
MTVFDSEEYLPYKGVPLPGGWARRARCVGMDTMVFFCGRGDTPAVRRAKDVCSRCPVRAECLEYAQRHNIRHGVWGGLSDKERRVVRVRKRRAA